MKFKVQTIIVFWEFDHCKTPRYIDVKGSVTSNRATMDSRILQIAGSTLQLH